MNAETADTRALQALSDHLAIQGVKSHVNHAEIRHRGPNHTEPHLWVELPHVIVRVVVVSTAGVYAWPADNWLITDPAGAAMRVAADLEQCRSPALRE